MLLRRVLPAAHFDRNAAKHGLGALDLPGLLATLAPKGVIHLVGSVPEPMQLSARGLIAGQKSVAGSPVGSPSAIEQTLTFSARHSIARELTKIDQTFASATFHRFLP